MRLEQEIRNHVLAQVDQETLVEYSDSDDDDRNEELGLVSFCLGLILIPFSMALLWKNEKKLVNFVRI